MLRFLHLVTFTHSVMRGVVGVDKNRLRLTVVVVLVVVPKVMQITLFLNITTYTCKLKLQVTNAL